MNSQSLCRVFKLQKGPSLRVLSCLKPCPSRFLSDWSLSTKYTELSSLMAETASAGECSGVDPATSEMMPSPSPQLSWRCRAKLVVRGSSRRPLVGLYREGTHTVTDIPHCTGRCRPPACLLTRQSVNLPAHLLPTLLACLLHILPTVRDGSLCSCAARMVQCHTPHGALIFLAAVSSLLASRLMLFLCQVPSHVPSSRSPWQSITHASIKPLSL